MYAVIQAGGKQYKVQEGDELFIEKIRGEQGDKIEVGRVIFVNNNGKITSDPQALSKVKVKATILKHILDDKVTIFKYKAKKGYSRKQGHRQNLTRVRIDKISLPKTKEIKPKSQEDNAEIT